MEIHKSTYSAKTAKTTKKKSGGSSAAFSSSLSNPTSTTGSSGVGYSANIGGLDSLLSLQEVSIQDEEQRRGKNYGNQILSELDQLRRSVLSGTISITQLESIQQKIEHARPDVQDMQLNTILDEIELRAKVEMAKYKKYGPAT